MSFWTEVTMHSALFLGFLTGFYFLFVTNIQTESLVNDLVNVAKQNLTLKAAFSTPDQINTAISQIDNELPGIQSSLQQSIQDNNQQILKIVSIVVGTIVPVLFISSFLIHGWYGGSISDLLISNFIVLLFIAISEFIIVGIFLRNFIEIDAEFIGGIVPATSGEHNQCNFVKEFLYETLPTPIVKLFSS